MAPGWPASEHLGGKMTPRVLLLIVTGAALTVHGGASALADPTAEFFGGKTVTVAVGTSAGGSYDAYARLLARHFGSHLPGNPQVTPRNMPGGGGLVLANHLYNVAPRDGTFIGALHRGVPFEPLIGSTKGQVKFDPLRLSWLGNMNIDTGITMVWHSAPHQSARDLFDKELIVGGAGPAGDFEITANVLRNLLGMKFRIISGYPGSNEAALALEQGEIQGLADFAWGGIRGQRAAWLKDNKIRLLMQIGLQKDPELPDLPLVLDFAKDAEQRAALELIFASKTIGRPFTLPQDIAADRLATLRAGFMAATKDQKLLAEAQKMKLDVQATTGEAVEAVVRKAFAAPSAVIQRAASSLAPNT